MCTGTAAGAVSLKNPHHIITLRFNEAVKDHANRMYMCKYKNNLRLVRQLDQSNPESLVHFPSHPGSAEGRPRVARRATRRVAF